MSLTNLPRWIKASYVAKIRELLIGAPLYVEGEDKVENKPAHFELRIDGPYVKPCGTRNEFRAYIEVNVLINMTRDESNRYAFDNLKGSASNTLNRDFCIYKTGNVSKAEEDDESLVGVMKLLPSDQIKASDFGMIDPNTEVYQGVVEAHYEMYFTLE